MVFNSAAFLFAFLPLAAALHRLIPGRRGKAILLALLSLVFYAFGGPAQVPVLLLCVLWNYAFGRLLARKTGPRKLWCTIAVAGDLGLLGIYKYTDFLLGTLGLSAPWGELTAPLGVSFFTFHAVSYIVDVYREPTRAETRLDALLLYLAFFPRLLAGPILTWRQAQPEPFGHAVSAEETAAALRRFIRGLGKKLLLAESAAAVANAVYALDAAALSTALAWLGGVSYCLQIYYDFSGYSDMAIALGALFGFTFPENFAHPYAARTLSDFWRRWHMSLNRWFLDYLYIPLGGSREGLGKTVRNTLIVFLFTGLWHGAGWTFILWGLWHGVFVSLERLGRDRLALWERKAPGRAVLHAYTLLVVLLGFVMFRSATVVQGFTLLGRMFSFTDTGAAGALAMKTILTPARTVGLILGAALSLPVGERLCSRLPVWAADALALALLLLCISAMAGGGFTPFIYQQF